MNEIVQELNSEVADLRTDVTDLKAKVEAFLAGQITEADLREALDGIAAADADVEATSVELPDVTPPIA